MPDDRLPPDDAGPLRHDDGAAYPAVEPQPSFPEVERSILEQWAADRTFEASVEARPAGGGGENEYVFYDGPPFANGLPHYGHLLTGFVKDAVPRYQTMRGRRVERRFGWDCHGLPAEMEAERELGISGRALITEYGIEQFNEHCRTSVLRYTSEWERYVTRQARWVDFRNDYKTMDLPYMESVMWALKQLWERGLLYEGHRVLPYCWECETPLSNFETRQDDAYRERQDPAVTVTFTLSDGRRILVWTTTPWTLPSNLALAVGPDIDYAVFTHEDGTTTILGDAAAPRYERELDGAERVGTVAGRDLVGLEYEPLFGWLKGTPNAFRVVAGDFVATDEGTGVVHMAPGFGEDDQRVCEDNGIPVVCPVDDRGRFTAEIADYEGLQVFAANARIIKDLRAAGALVRHDTMVHSYPHCWRTDTPLIYKAVSSWFVNVRAVKDRMLELNQEITWVPDRVRDGAFGKWLENARDWSISRNRFWGSPIPVWKSDDPAHPRVDVYGGLDELERDFGVRPDDLHRPAVDRLTRPNPDDPTGRSTMRRVEDVLDCWFESGSMPFAQVHYPFEQRDWFESHFPADFIVEYIGQTRGWFYTLHVLATALFDRPPFTTCVAHGVVLGHDGQKMSKRLRNYPDPDEVFDTLGADAMRWFLLSSPVLRGADLVVDRKGITGALRRSISPLWNAWSFFALYANAEGYRARWRTDSAHVLDRYVLAKAHELVAGVTARMDEYDLFGACALVESFLDALTNWYIRRSRDRFWATSPADPEETAQAFDTLFTVLHVVCRVAAPLLPLVTEAVFRGLTAERSVHLTDWPAADELPADVDLVAAMDLARDVCSAAHSVRKAAELRSRLPLASLTVAAPGADRLAPFAPLIAAELNVKDVRLSDDVGSAGDLVLQVVPAVLGPRIGPEVQAVIRAAKSGNWSRDDGAVVVAGRRLAEDEYALRLVPRDESTTRPLPGDRGLVVLDLAVTPDLEAEGLARDVVRLVNDARKEAGLQVTDRIRLVLQVPDDLRTAVDAHRAYVADQTLAVEVLFVEHLAGGYRGELPDGRAVHIGVSPLAH